MSASVTQDDINIQQALQRTVESLLKIQLFCHSTSYIYEDSQRGISKTFKSPSGVAMTREYGCSWKPVSFYLNCNTICQSSLKKHGTAPDSTGEELLGRNRHLASFSFRNRQKTHFVCIHKGIFANSLAN